MDVENTRDTANQTVSAPVNKAEAPSPEAKILKQMEFYFSDENLPSDDFLLKEVSKDEQGFVPLEVFLRFRRIKEVTSETSVIAEALKNSSLLSLSEDGQKVKRATPLPTHIDDTERTIYAKGFKLYPEPSIEELTQFFGQFGNVSAVRLRRYVAPKKFKGSVFVTFATTEEAQKVLQEQKDLSYNGHTLEMHSRAEYDASEYAKGSVPTEHVQWQSIFERRRAEEAPQENGENKPEEAFTPIASANLIKFNMTGSLSYQDIRAKVNKVQQVNRVVVPGRDQDYGMIAFKDAAAEAFLAAHPTMTVGESTLTFEKPSEVEVESFNKAEAVRSSREKAKKNGTAPRGRFNAPRLQAGCTVKFVLQDDCKTAEERRALQAAFEKFGPIALLELRRYHKSGLINYTKSFNRALFMRKIAESPITDAQNRPVECSVPSDEEEKDLFARSRAMHEAQELEKMITTEDLKYPARYTPHLKKHFGKNKPADAEPAAAADTPAEAESTKRKAEDALEEAPAQKKVSNEDGN